MKKERLGKGILSLAMAAVLGAASFLPAAAAYPAGEDVWKAAEQTSMEAEMLAHYPLQENAEDITENHNDGKINGNVTWSEGLVLPGGKGTGDAAASDVTLPQGRFDGQDELTISVWLKSNTNKGNYSALFFGTPPQSSNNMPLNYWLFNPTDPTGYFKSVFTDSNKTSAPYETEVGVTSASTEAYKGVWTHYTTVLTEDSVTGYINGKKIGTAAKTKTTSDFGTGLQAYIGRSNYLADQTYAGSFQDLRIYSGALDADGIRDVYADTGYVTGEIQEKVEAEAWTLVSLDKALPQGMVTDETPLALPKQIGSSQITWSSDHPEIISGEGKVALPAKSTTVTLTAAVKGSAKTAEKNFAVHVKGRESSAKYLISYNNSQERTDLGMSLHLAYSEDGSAYTALNSNTGICFAKNSGSAKDNNKNVLNAPYIFPKKDGGYGMIAANSSSASVYLFDSEDLVHFTNERTLKVSSGPVVQEPRCSYDEETDTYLIQWKNGLTQYETVSADLKTCGETREIPYVEEVVPAAGIPEGAVVSQILEVTPEEYQKVVDKLGPVTNTGIEEVKRTLQEGSSVDMAQLLPKTVTLDYSDGSQKEMKVVWEEKDVKDIRTDKPGTYQVKGTVQQTQYENPFIEQRADPCILKGDDGYYYFTASYPMLGDKDMNGYDKVVLRRSKTIEGLKDAEEVTIWDCDGTTGMYRYIWAPEIRLIAGDYYIYYTASVESWNVWGIRPHVLKCTDPENIMNPASWEEEGRFQAAAGDTKAFTNFSLDMTYFENNGHHYAIWAQTDECSSLFMAEIDPEEPWKCTSKSIRLSYPDYSWERVNENVNEGASVIKRDGKIYIAFSASGTGPEYTIGLLSADADADLMDVNSWTKQGYPVLTSADVPGEYGPGHNSFTVDEDGNDIFVYHARSEECYRDQCNWANQGPLYDPCRDARLKRVHWAADGTPILKMTYGQELAEEFRTITAQVTVQAKEKPEPSEPETPSTETPSTDKPVEKPSVPMASKVILSNKTIRMGQKEKVSLKAKVYPAGAEQKVVWKSSKKSVVSVSSKGVLTAKKTGKAVITAAASNGIRAKCTVTVKKAPKKLSLTTKARTLKKGKTYQIKAKFPAGTYSHKLTFKSSKKSVAAVSSTGKVSAKKKGKAVITVKTFNGKKAKIKITVK